LVYLKNDPEHVLPKYTDASTATVQRSWSDGPPTAEQEKWLEVHWAVLARLRNTVVDLAAVVGQYHA
jgi:hypothetical protein